MILDRILAHKRAELASRKRIMPLNELEKAAQGLPAPLPLAPSIRRSGELAVIAETKKASPSKGILCKNYNPVKIVAAYEQAGAAAISVLTEEKFFLGHPCHLVLVKRAVRIPVLRKDFIIDPYQIYESRALGADAVLLIVAALSPALLAELTKLAGDLGLSCLVEVHTERELSQALAYGAEIIGINNRNLHNFVTDLSVTFNLIDLIDLNKITVVSESGIKNKGDILRLKERGVHAALVGEALVRCAEPGQGLIKLTDFRAGG
ncbi:indole-3-glycerol phosphate synthase TrpC [Pelotomaculum propionicicum]|uniref:Indole-3-glycerol phosphate synthase n=1 Tax=Pelotomaculum propionicicum TaxID=258475 RepID=A0A4Y7RSI0_9FIRM|nr:indole-3-glycerol phosphate synthase TrpC [Pelotomaculum propionicicum]TEB11811.1 Indole-3-glycerol phosphate synthase [Pelotomaculum propionicicum]